MINIANSPSEPPSIQDGKDLRITRIWVRETSMDVLQLINVLNGEMKLIGPRPPIPIKR